MHAWMSLIPRFRRSIALAAVLAISLPALAREIDPADLNMELPVLSEAQLKRVRDAMSLLAAPSRELARLRDDSGAKRAQSEDRQLLLGSNGRFADLRFDTWSDPERRQIEENSEPDYGEIGAYRWEGDWLVLVSDGHLTGEQSVADQDLQMAVGSVISTMPEGVTVDAAVEQLIIFIQQASESGMHSDSEAEDDRQKRLLRISHADGYLLIEEERLPDVAQRWSGEGPLWLTYGVMWSENLRPGLSLRAGLNDEGFAIDSPLSAATPEPLRKLLRPEPIEARVAGAADDPAARDWSWGNAQARYRLDKGSAAGLYVGMSLYPQDLGDSPSLRVEEVAPDHAIAIGQLSRFAPTDAPLEPREGQVYVTRHVGARQSCGIDTSAAVRARMTAVRALHEGEADEEGFLWFEVDIDHGSRAGLELEQSLSLEGAEFAAGESRVRALRPDSATLLWRMHEAMSQGETKGPRIDGHAVTRAWQTAATEVFGH
jgi:hypothetical protein